MATSAPPRVLVVDHDPAFRRQAVASLVRGGFECDPAAGREEVEARMAESVYDLLLVELHLPDGGGLDLLRSIRERGNTTGVALITSDPSLATAIEAVRLSAVDYLIKPAPDLDQRIRESVARARARPAIVGERGPPDDWARWIRDLRSELSLLEAAVQRAGLGRTPPPAESRPGYEQLSDRERQVADQIASGLGVQEIAAGLEVSPHTVRNHLKAVYRKLGVRSQVELVLALRQ